MGTITYARDKNPATNSTGIATSGEAREDPNALVAIAAGAGSFYELAISGDADPSGGAAIVELFRIKATPTLGATDPGPIGLTLEITPVLGDGSDGTPFTVQQLVHPQTMSAWQTAAGFPPVA
jgi:hypothetical protein